MSKQKDKYLALRRQLPDIIDEYISYLQVDVEEPSPKMVERLSVIQKFLNSYAITIDKEGASLSLTDLEKLPREFVQNYLANLRLKPAGKRFILYTLAGFWNYLTNTSFTIERGMPLFYRNVFNEWKIVYKESYHNIIYSESKKKYNFPRIIQIFLNCYLCNKIIILLYPLKYNPLHLGIVIYKMLNHYG